MDICGRDELERVGVGVGAEVGVAIRRRTRVGGDGMGLKRWAFTHIHSHWHWHWHWHRPPDEECHESSISRPGFVMNRDGKKHHKSGEG